MIKVGFYQSPVVVVVVLTDRMPPSVCLALSLAFVSSVVFTCRVHHSGLTEALAVTSVRGFRAKWRRALSHDPGVTSTTRTMRNKVED